MAWSKERWVSFCMGSALTACIFLALILFVLRPAVKDLLNAEAGVSAARAENDQKANELIKKCTEDWKATAELYSQATLLMEPQASAQTALFGLALDALAPGLGRALAQTDKSGRPAMRWYIPLKVEPVVYGDAQGATYLWFDRDTKKMSGPFTPENLR